MDGHIKYGHVRGGVTKAGNSLVWAASQTVKARSGRFVYNNAGAITLCGDGADEILGFAEEAEGTPATGAPASVIVDPTAVYRIPVGAGTFAASMVGKTCDLKVTSNIQGADLATSTDDVFIIVDGDLTDNAWVEVMLNQIERAQSGV